MLQNSRIRSKPRTPGSGTGADAIHTNFGRNTVNLFKSARQVSEQRGNDGMSPEHVGDGIEAGRAAWHFGGAVPESFEDMARRSIPLYEEGHDLILRISDSFLADGSTVYDLGCATGRLLGRLAKRHAHRAGLRLIGVDREAAMIEKARRDNTDPSIEFHAEDLIQMDFGERQADLIICYYTVQFVRPAVRQDLIDRLFRALNWGGALLLFEKTRGPDARFQDLITGLYNDYKVDRGYGAEEILAKTRSLKGILEPFSTQGNFDLLARAGFQDCMTILKFICFEGIIAIK